MSLRPAACGLALSIYKKRKEDREPQPSILCSIIRRLLEPVGLIHTAGNIEVGFYRREIDRRKRDRNLNNALLNNYP